MTDKKKTDIYIQIAITMALALNIAFWFSVRSVEARWGNVPPPPGEQFAAVYGLGDTNFSYRLNGIMLQNMGDTGGRYTSLNDYDYSRLTQWFFLQDKLDPVSNYIPYLATFYFGAVQEAGKYRPVLEYLKTVGVRPYGEKWRWLVYGVQMAKSNIGDKDEALVMANILARSKHPNMPGWVRQMPAFVMLEKGEKDEAYALMLEILKTSANKLHPNEVNSMKIYICTKILEKEAAASNPLCEGIH